MLSVTEKNILLLYSELAIIVLLDNFVLLTFACLLRRLARWLAILRVPFVLQWSRILLVLKYTRNAPKDAVHNMYVYICITQVWY